MAFRSGERVRFYNLGGDRLDGKTGEVVGIASKHIVSFYIVLLDEPFWSQDRNDTHEPFYYRAVTMLETCMERE